MIKWLIQHYLDETSAKFPQKTAIKSGDKSITYRELDEKSGRLANMLMELGCKQRDVVAIYLDKSVEAVIAMFGILKAGCTYIPLDSHYSPVGRIGRILGQSEAKYIVSSRKLWDVLNGSGIKEFVADNVKAILMDGAIDNKIESSEKGTEQPDAKNVWKYNDSLLYTIEKKLDITDDDLAYILYTSGSTGVPKGVMLSHLNAKTFINWALNYFQPTENDVFSNFAPLHFDLSVFDIYVSVACGGCLNLLPFETAKHPGSVAAWIKENQVGYVYSVPSVWISILNYAHTNWENFRSVKKILFAGEVFPPQYLKSLMEAIPDAQYYNLYGPTETNVCTYYHVDNKDEIVDKPVPIGSACENIEVVVLSEKDEPVSIGEEGELFVKGSNVMKGYYKALELSEAVFKKSPFIYHGGAMLYGTGDIVRKCGEGIYEFIGRKDSMVKCSGFRIELMEVENAFYKSDEVEEAVAVSIMENESGKNTLCAVLKMKDGKTLSVVRMKNFLAGILPKYMIPEIITSIDEIPKNENGKANRQKLTQWLKEKIN